MNTDSPRYQQFLIIKLADSIVTKQKIQLLLKMSKSPIKDFSRLIEPNTRTVKKEEIRREQLLNSAYHSKYESSFQNTSFLNELKLKLDASLRHNTSLLDENSTLGQMANQLRHQLKMANDKVAYVSKEAEDLLIKTKNERESLLLEVEVKQRSHQSELEKLLREISVLHEEKNSIEIQKQKQIERLKNQFESSLVNQLQNIRSCQNNSKDLYETQIRNLKEIISQKEHQIENIKAIQKLEKTRLTDQIKSYEKEIRHIKQSFSLEIQTLKHTLETDLNSQKKRLENEKEIELSGLNLKLKKLKKDIIEKNLELEHVGKKMIHQDQLLSMESAQFKKEKQTLLSELKSNQIYAKNLLSKEKNKLDELGKLEVENLTKMFQINIEELQGQNYKLKQLIECKKEELKELYDQNQRIKDSYDKQIELLTEETQHLKGKIHTLQLQNKDEIETFKIKMANLLENDIKAISGYYQNQIKAYIDKVGQNDKTIAGLKERLYKSLQQNDEVRKNFQAQISKQRARVQDLKIKLASIQLEHKQHVSNLGSKVQLTSQTLIREAEHKQKSKGQYEQQKKKYHYLANTKDKQISDLMVMMENMKRIHEDELKVLRAEKMHLRSEMEDAISETKRVKGNYEQELNQKEEKMKSLVFSNEKELQEIKDLEDKIEILEKNNMKIKKQYEHLQLVNASIAQELGLSKGFIESLQLESNAAIEDERAKFKAFIGSHQIGIKEYFEDKIKSKERDIDTLNKILAEKQDDIRDLIVKYNALQKRMDMMMETNSKLREFEEKIKSLGLDNNLIKNMAELFKK